MSDITISDYLAIGSILVSLFTVIYVSKFHRFELRNVYRRELLEWYEETIRVIINIESTNDSHSKNELLVILSKQIEIGRFFFPNQKEKKKKKDEEKHLPPLAYRGNRHLILDCLVMIFDVYNSGKEHDKKSDLIWFKKYFTSELFYVLDPHKHLGLSIKNRLSKGLNKKSMKDVFGHTPEEYSKELYQTMN